MNKKILSTCFLICLFAITSVAKAEEENISESNIQSEEAKNSSVVDSNIEYQAYFDNGYKLFAEKEYESAIPYFHNYLQNISPDESNYEWASFFLGISLEKAGLSHSSVDVLANLVMRKPNPKIVIYILELFEHISRTIPFDKIQVIQDVVSSQEFGFAEGKMADFIHYYQGLYDIEHGFFNWGNKHFEKIEQQSYYYFKYLYQKALRHVYNDDVDGAIDILKEILSGSINDVDLKDETRQLLARLLYEKGMFDESILFYKQISQPMTVQAHNLLEMAWGQFRMGNARQAMGLLYAYNAPEFNDSFTPEYFILKSFIYKNLCHYEKAMAIVSLFNKQFDSSLEHIYNRDDAADDHALLSVLMNRKKIEQTWRFIELLEREREESKRFTDESLLAYLDELYVLQLDETTGYFRKLVEEEYAKLADKLLRYEEEAELMEYEIGLDMYQRVYQYHYEKDNQSGTKSGSKKRVVIYPFQGEYWNDELDSLRVSLPDKCKNMEEWDIFFK